MDNLGDSLRKYLEDEGEKFPEKEEIKKKPKKKTKVAIDDTILGPFISVFKGVTESFGALVGFKGFEAKEVTEIPGECSVCGTKFKVGAKECKKCGRFFGKVTSVMKYKWDKDKGGVKKEIDSDIWRFYKAFKSAHGFLTW